MWVSTGLPWIYPYYKHFITEMSSLIFDGLFWFRLAPFYSNLFVYNCSWRNYYSSSLVVATRYESACFQVYLRLMTLLPRPEICWQCYHTGLVRGGSLCLSYRPELPIFARIWPSASLVRHVVVNIRWHRATGSAILHLHSPCRCACLDLQILEPQLERNEIQLER